VDLHLIPDAVASDEERAAVDEILGPPRSGWEGGERLPERDGRMAVGGRAARERRHLLLPALHAVQGRVGWIGPGALNYVCRRLTVPPAEAYGVASFYSLFSLDPGPRTMIHVCDDIACRTRGSLAICDQLERRLGPAGSRPTDGRAGWQRSPCLGLCERAPATLFQVAGDGATDWSLAPADSGTIRDGLEGRRPASAQRGLVPQAVEPRDPGLRLLRRIGCVDPEDLDSYRAQGGYRALRRALALGPDGVIREVSDGGLMGRGGAAFPTGRKWEAVSRATVRPHYLVCNADESEPGTFKDRILMELDPFAIIEAMTIAGFATGCEQGFIYVRGEYPLAAARLEGAVNQVRRRGYLGTRVMGESVRFDIDIRRGAGAYICGEETALFNSIEGYRGEPRNKPPFPTRAGLFGKPTVINNVETLVNVLDIVLEGGPAFASIGTARSTGTRLFCLSGSINAPGLYEVPFGTTLRDLLALAGGVPGGRALRAVLLGGAAGTFITPEEIDVRLTFEDTGAIGASLGSGVVMVFDETIDLADTLLRIATFFRDESCGQCVPCRVGTERQEESLHRMAAGRPLGSAGDEELLLDDVARAMRDASICGLGQTAANAVQSAFRKLRLFGPNGGRTA
jgi:NADH-quinone oxidoreductase subunit F